MVVSVPVPVPVPVPVSVPVSVPAFPCFPVAPEFAPVYASWPNPQPHILNKGQVTALGNMNIILEQCSALLVGLEIYRT